MQTASWAWERIMAKKVIIEVVLVPEASNKQSGEIEREILEEIRYGSLVIPWCDRVEKISVVDEETPDSCCGLSRCGKVSS